MSSKPTNILLKKYVSGLSFHMREYVKLFRVAFR